MAKILVVDDDASMRLMLNRVLAMGGHTVIEAQNGAEGLRVFHSDHPDLIVMDMMMPEQDGFEAMRDIRQSGSKVGIIAISGGGSIGGDMYLDFSKKLGADDILHKPFRPAELLERVGRILGRG
jgi:OmpR family response regulator RpaB